MRNYHLCKTYIEKSNEENAAVPDAAMSRLLKSLTHFDYFVYALWARPLRPSHPPIQCG